ncbi:MAG: efflux RND transporter permease subunit, partial [Gemmatimonadetes bacterium]|nr:efflux RND transporter permease subunit [Gemmatimonadota bacterium]
MKGLIAWFAGNSVAANLLMGLIVIAGLFTLPTIKQEIFPEFSLDIIAITVVYRGAAPEEVEEGVCLRIEEAVQDLEGIKHITSNASEGVGSVSVELEIGYDSGELLDDIKARVDAIETFPIETEKPVITELRNRRAVIDVVIWGDVEEEALKAIGQRVRDDINAIPGITQVDLVSARPYEIAIEISETDLRRYGLTFEEVAGAIRRSSLDLPGGSIRAREGEILLRATGQAYEGDEFASIVLRTRPDGTRLMLGDVANVVDGFAETDESARFSGKPAVGVRVFRVGNQAALDVAEKAKAYVDEAQADMPAGVTITHWNDQSRILRGRLDLMTRSARNGYLLVLGVLALFLRFRLAFWVSLGIPISFLGAIWLMPTLDVSINLISLFAFIVVLGIVVDDAIIIGENIFKHQERDGASVATSARAAGEVALPVVFGILTTVAAFYPLLNVVGTTGKVMRVIPMIVIATLLFSMIESLLILPAHLAHKSERRLPVLSRISDVWRRFQGTFSNGLTNFIEHRYSPFLYRAIKWRYTTIGIAVATLVLTIGLVSGGWIRFQFFPRVESDFVAASLTLT